LGIHPNDISGFLPKILQLCWAKKHFFVKNVSRETMGQKKKPE